MWVSVVGAVTLALAGCGTAPRPSAAPAHRATEHSKPSESPAKQATVALARALAHNSTGAFGFTPGEARCVAKGFVNQFGVAGIQSMGLVTKDFKPGHPSGGLHMSGVDASAAADATLACVNGPGFVQNLLTKSSGSSTAACIAQNLGARGTHEAMAAAFAGDRRVLEQALLPALAQCGSASPGGSASPAAQSSHAAVHRSPAAPADLSVGDTAKLGDWMVTVLSVNTDADRAIAAADQYNPKPEGQYVLATYTVKYLGTSATAEPFMELPVDFTTNTGQVLNDAAGPLPPRSQQNFALLRPGGTLTMHRVFDVPPNEINGGRLAFHLLGGTDPVEFNF